MNNSNETTVIPVLAKENMVASMPSPVEFKQPVQNISAPKKKFPVKIIAVGGGALVIVLAVILIIAKLSPEKSNYIFQSDDLVAMWVDVIGYDTIHSFTTKEGKLISDLPATLYETTLSSNQSVISALSEDDELYVISQKGAKKVAEEVSSAVISDDGTGIAYTTYSDGYSTYAGDLFIYNVSKDKSEKIATECRQSSMTISPDGDSIAFIKDYESEFDYKMCVSINGKEIETIGTEKTPFAIADDGKSYIISMSN